MVTENIDHGRQSKRVPQIGPHEKIEEAKSKVVPGASKFLDNWGTEADEIRGGLHDVGCSCTQRRRSCHTAHTSWTLKQVGLSSFSFCRRKHKRFRPKISHRGRYSINNINPTAVVQVKIKNNLTIRSVSFLLGNKSG